MVLLTSTFLTVVSWAALISAATVNMVKKDCTLMTAAELGARQFLFLLVHCRFSEIMKQSRNRRIMPLMLRHLLTTEITRTTLLSTIPMYEPAHSTIPCLLTNVEHKFPGSPANVCDNLATGIVWVEYNDRVRICCMLRLSPVTDIERSVRSTVISSVSTG